jgi:hypothetical protein
MSTSDKILLLTILAIVLAPVVAIGVGVWLQQRSDAYKLKLDVFSRLVGLRHAPLSEELVRTLNQIDAVFADNPAVRDAWTRYHAALIDGNLSMPPGSSIREEKRYNLLLEMVRALKLTRKISSADLLRTYFPNFIAEEMHVTTLERLYKRVTLEEELNRRGVAFPPCVVPLPMNLIQNPPATIIPPTGNGADQRSAPTNSL